MDMRAASLIANAIKQAGNEIAEVIKGLNQITDGSEHRKIPPPDQLKIDPGSTGEG